MIRSISTIVRWPPLKRSKRSLLSVLLLISLLALTACGGAASKQNETPKSAEPAKTDAAQPAGPKSFQTDLGELKLEKTPSRIVAINLQAIDSLAALGVKPVGYAQPGGEPVNYLGDFLDGIPTVGSHSKPALETVLSLQPDLIIIDSAQQKDLIPELQKIAPVLGMRSVSYQETMSQLKLLGDILGKREVADKFAADFDAKVKGYISKAGGKEGPKVSAIFGSADRPGVWLKESFIGSLFTAVNAPQAYSGPGEKDYPDLIFLSLEKIFESNPQVYFFMSTPGKELSKAWASNPAFKGTEGVKSGRVHEVDRQLWSRSRGPVAATKILDEIFPLLYPEAK